MNTAISTLPFWQGEPCPTWCDWIHRAGDLLDDREHWSSLEPVPLRLHPALGAELGGEVEPDQATLAISQHVDHAAPRLRLCREGQRATAFELTAAECRELAAQLLKGADLMESGAGSAGAVRPIGGRRSRRAA